MIQILFLLHLLSALPIVLSPPFQFCEEIIKIPKSKNYILYLNTFPHSFCFRIWVAEGCTQNNSDGFVATHWTFSAKFWSNSKSYWSYYNYFAQFYLSANILFTFGKKIQNFTKHFFTTRNTKYKIRRI